MLIFIYLLLLLFLYLSTFYFRSQAIEDFQMIEDGDRVLLCLSGGKDSLSMLHIIRQYQFYAKKKVSASIHEIL